MNIELVMKDETTNVINLLQTQVVSFYDKHVNFGMVGAIGFTIEEEDINMDFESFKETLKSTIRAFNERNPHYPQWLFVNGVQVTDEEHDTDPECCENFINPSYVDIVKRSFDDITLFFVGGGGVVINDKIEMMNIDPVLSKLFPVTVKIG